MNECPMLYSYFEIHVGWQAEEANKQALIKRTRECDSKALAKLIAMDHTVIKESYAFEKRIKLIKDLNSSSPSKKNKAKKELKYLHKAELGERPFGICQ